MVRPLSATVSEALRQARWTPIEAHVVLAAVRASGLSLGAFAPVYGVDYQRLYAWRRRFAASEGASEPGVQFVELRAAVSEPRTPATARYEIELPGGEILRVEGCVEPTVVGALLALLRGTGHTC